MFEDLPPPQVKAKEGDSSVKKDESSSVSWSGFAMPPELNTQSSLKFKPRFVATGVKETVSKALPSKAPKKDPNGFKHSDLEHDSCVESEVSKSVDMIEAPYMGSTPGGIDLNPSAYVHSFDTVDTYDPSIPNDYQELQRVAVQERVIEEENAQRNRYKIISVINGSEENLACGNFLTSVRPTPRIPTKRNINNQPAWLDAMKKDGASVMATPQFSSSRVYSYQALDYSTLSLTLSVVGVLKQLKSVLLHLETFGDFTSNVDNVLSSADKLELLLVFKSQAPCILSYHSLAVGRAREICMQSNEIPLVKFLY